MANQCPVCSRKNPPQAFYCYYDGGALSPDHKGPLQVGSMPFPMKFFFGDGVTCNNFNQLALACNNHWDEARGMLTDDSWSNFFRSMGRLDLANVAKQAGLERDLDFGLSQLLEKLPTDPGVYRAPKLELDVNEMNLGQIEPGVDKQVDLTLFNQGMCVLHGTVTTNCEWLVLGERAASWMFQTRNSCSIPIRVSGDRLRAGRQPLVGEINVSTNGGVVTVPVKLSVPVKPFPSGKYANESLAGVTTPRELAVKAKKFPKEAGVLFEQGAVKSWYGSNGWTYPVEGTSGSGKAAVQQFFEALGLTKPPKLEIDVKGVLAFAGEPGQKLVKNVTISTQESKHVFAQARSNQKWATPLAPKSKGNQVVVPIRVTVPSRVGETLKAAVTIHGNGRQQFVVPVAIKVLPPAIQPKKETSSPMLKWVLGGVAACSLLLVTVVVAAFMASRGGENPDPLPGPPIEPVVVIPAVDPKIDPKLDPVDPNPLPKPIIPVAPPKTKTGDGAWWANIKDSRIPAAMAALKKVAPAEAGNLERLAKLPDNQRHATYQQMLDSTPALVARPEARQPLGELISDFLVFEPDDLNATPLLRWLVRQIPLENAAFAPGTSDADLERMFWALGVSIDTLSHPSPAAVRKRVDQLAEDLGSALGAPIDVKAPDRTEAERLLAMRCYRNAPPTVADSVDLALSLRESLLKKMPEHLPAGFREKIDMNLITAGLKKGDKTWPKFEPILRTCLLESTELTTHLKIVDIYEGAEPAMATSLETVLSEKWKVAADAKLKRPAKVEALRKALTRNPADRLPRMSKVAETALAAKPGAKQGLTSLQDTVRLAHASAMAAALYHKGPALDRFDDLAEKVPEIDQKDTATAKPAGNEKTNDDPKVAGKNLNGIVVGARGQIIAGVLNAQNERVGGKLAKVYLFNFKGGQLYTIDLMSGAFDTYLRLQDARGFPIEENDDGGVGLNSRIVFQCRADGVYRVVATTFGMAAGGPYTLSVRQGVGFAPFAPFGVPFPQPQPQPQPEPEKKNENEPDPQAIPREIAQLESKKAAERTAAMEKIATLVKGEIPPSQAQKIAKYLLSAKEKEVEDVADRLASFARCQALLLALSDGLARDEGTLKSTEMIVSGILERRVPPFAKNEEWRVPCRKLLLQKALELAQAKRNGADDAADSLRDSYREQGLILGMDEKSTKPMTRPSLAVAGVIKHVAGLVEPDKVDAEDKAYLADIDRQIEIAQFLAANDLERTALLQRTWVHVLTLYLKTRTPARADAMTKLYAGFIDEERNARGVLDQLRAGEETALRLWIQANELK